jgi:hypothetical protein
MILWCPLTAKTHVSRIMTKLNARDRAQLVVIAYESGLVTRGSGPSTGRAGTDIPTGIAITADVRATV